MLLNLGQMAAEIEPSSTSTTTGCCSYWTCRLYYAQS